MPIDPYTRDHISQAEFDRIYKRNRIASEATCDKCGETFNPNDADDLEHAVREDGTECGGKGKLSGSWR